MERLNRLRAELAKQKIPAALIMKSENIFYLTGYTGEGCLFVGLEEALILTDFRYTEQASRQSPSCGLIRTSVDNPPQAVLRERMREGGYTKLAVETDYMTHDVYNLYREALKDVALLPMNRLPEVLRRIKDAGEIARIQKAAEISCKAFEELLGWVRPGMTEKQVQRRLDYSMLDLGAEALGFDTIVCAGPNGSLPHAIPGDRPIQSGDLMTMDFGAKYQGYVSDMTRTIAFGPISGELQNIYDVTLAAQMAALAMIRPGVRCADVDKAARDIIDAVYPGAFGHSLGHGVGLLVHEEPSFSRTSNALVEPGHVITVEPGIYIEGLGGCRIEDMVIITEDGYINPITAPKHLIFV